MKKIILTLLLTISIVNAAEPPSNNLELGGYLMIPKFTYNLDCVGNSYTFFSNTEGGTVDFGVSAMYPLNKSNKDIKALLEIGYANYAFKYDASLVEHIYYGTKLLYPDYALERFNTINISPQIYLHSFTVGLDFGIYIPHTLLNIQGDGYNSGYYYKEQLSKPYLINLKLGGVIPIYKTSLGTLNVLLKATTSLSYIGNGIEIYLWEYNSADNTQSLVRWTLLDKIQIITASVGLNYMFNMRF